MNITHTIKTMAASISFNVEQENREPLYESLLSCFDDDEFLELEVDEVLGIDEVFDDVLFRAQPDLFDTGSYDEEDDDENGFIDSMDDEWTDNDEE